MNPTQTEYALWICRELVAERDHENSKADWDHTLYAEPTSVECARHLLRLVDSD